MRLRKIITSTLLIALAFCAGCREAILHKLDERDANRVKVALSEAGIDAEKIPDGSLWSIRVERHSAEEALSILERGRVLPEAKNSNAAEGRGLLQSKEERRHFLERGMAAALEETLERMPGVLEARVHINLSESSVFSAAPGGSASAGVLLISPRQNVDQSQVKQLVSGAAGLKPDAVSVVVASPTKEEKSASPPAAPPPVNARFGLETSYLWALPPTLLLLAAAAALGRLKTTEGRLKRNAAAAV